MEQTVYHGTNAAFTAFDPRYLGCSCDNPTTRFGFFFSECPADALSWALRASQRRRAPDAPRVLAVRLNLRNPLTLTYERFAYYLKTARPSTIERHRRAWIDAGHDGFTVVREGVRWFAAFEVSSIGAVSVWTAVPPMEKAA